MPASAIIKAVSSSSNKSSSTGTPTKILLIFFPVRASPERKRLNHERRPCAASGSGSGSSGASSATGSMAAGCSAGDSMGACSTVSSVESLTSAGTWAGCSTRSCCGWSTSCSSCFLRRLKKLNINTLCDMANQTVRIVGGQYRGRRIPIMRGNELRPTPDRVRETLFNWLRHFWAGHFADKQVLDLFAGTGVLGFEAASHGVAFVQLVEQNQRAAQALRQFRNTLGAEQIRIHHGDAMHVLERSTHQYDLILQIGRAECRERVHILVMGRAENEEEHMKGLHCIE